MDAFDLADASFWLIVASSLFVIALFVLWQVQKDLRRIAVGIEALTQWASVFHDHVKAVAPRPLPTSTQPAQSEQPPAPSSSEESGGSGSIPLSTFGR